MVRLDGMGSDVNQYGNLTEETSGAFGRHTSKG